MGFNTNIVGKKFERLLVVSQSYKKDKCKTYCECICDCGNTVSVRKDGLKEGDYKSCGCWFPGKTKVSCSQCGIQMERIPSQIHDIMWCSSECKSLWQSENMSGANAGNYKGGKIAKICKTCREDFEVFKKDKKQKFCSSQCYGIHLTTLRGPETSRWKNADYHQKQRKSPEYAQWRLSVLERDNHTCQKCGTDDAWMQAHHIKPYAQYEELRLEVNNGITFCKECHDEFHSEYGKIKVGEKELQEYIK